MSHLNKPFGQRESPNAEGKLWSDEGEQMRQSRVLLASFLILFFSACGSEADVNQRFTELYQSGSLEKALEVVAGGIDRFGPTDEMLHNKYKVLTALERYEDALETFEIILGRVGHSPGVVIDKVRLLMKLARYQEALVTALSVEEQSEEKSAFISYYICKIYAHLGDREAALDWMATSFDRGDIAFEYYLDDEFSSLHSSERFAGLVERMKAKAGIGLEAPGFNVPLIPEGSFALSGNRGKVTLIDFWATWCPPCVAEIPRLKRVYAELSEVEFDIVGISLDTDRARLESFLKQKHLPWRTGFPGDGMESDVAKLFKVQGAPKYLIIDREGIVRYSSEMGGASLESAIRQVVNEVGEDSPINATSN